MTTSPHSNRRLALLGLAAIGGAGICGCSLAVGAPAKTAAAGKARPDLYDCEGCQTVLERDPAALPSRLRLAAAGQPGERMVLTGRVLTVDGAPAPGVVIYAHHTNAEGYYADGTPETEWSRRHGRLRGWVKTDADGRYGFDTIKPAPYPDRTMPAHVHLFIQEPGYPPYYVDDVVFAGEFKVDEAYRAKQELRGGGGVVTLTRDAGGVWRARRDIRLERRPA